MKNKVVKSLLSAVAASFLMLGVASADMLTGGVSFNGFNWSPMMDGTDVVGIDFEPNTGIAGSGTGDLVVLNTLTVTNNDIVWSPYFNAMTPLWIVDAGAAGSFWFDLNSITVLTNQEDLISLKGVGTLDATYFDPTPGSWALTAQSRGTDGYNTFSWSSSTAAVPEPATMLLFGTGLVGLVRVVRKRKAAK